MSLIIISNILALCIFHLECSTSKSISTHSCYYQTLSRTGIARWPYRKMKSLEKKRQSLCAAVGLDAGILIDFAQFSSVSCSSLHSAASTPSTSQAHSPSPATWGVIFPPRHSPVDESSLILAARSNSCDDRDLDLKGAARKQQPHLEFRASESRHWSVPLSLPENDSVRSNDSGRSRCQ